MRQNLGQHFLNNPAIAIEIAAAVTPAAGDTIIEIGPGHGELTQAIFDACEKSGGKTKIVTIERDPELAAALPELFKDANNFKVIEGDALDKLAPTVAALLPGPYKIVGNLPYYLTGHLLRIISELERKPTRAVFMIQKEVAERMVAEPPRMNRLAAAVQFWAEPRLLRIVKRGEFTPPPEVDSAVVVLETKTNIDSATADAFYAMVRGLFAQPRKTVFNNLKDALTDRNLKGDAIKNVLEQCGIDPQSRPQDLQVAEILKIGQAVEEIK